MQEHKWSKKWQATTQNYFERDFRVSTLSQANWSPFKYCTVKIRTKCCENNVIVSYKWLEGCIVFKVDYSWNMRIIRGGRETLVCYWLSGWMLAWDLLLVMILKIYLMMFRSHQGRLWLCVPHLFLCLSRKPFDSVVLASAVCRGVFYMQWFLLPVNIAISAKFPCWSNFDAKS